MTDDARYNPTAKALCLLLEGTLARLARTAAWHSPHVADRQQARATLRATLVQALVALDALPPDEPWEVTP